MGLCRCHPYISQIFLSIKMSEKAAFRKSEKQFRFVDHMCVRVAIFFTFSFIINITLLLCYLIFPKYTLMYVIELVVFLFCVPPLYLIIWILINGKTMIKMSSERPSTLDIYYRFQTIDIPYKSLHINRGSIQPAVTEKCCGWYHVLLLYQIETEEKKTLNIPYTISTTTYSESETYISDINDTLDIIGKFNSKERVEFCKKKKNGRFIQKKKNNYASKITCNHPE